MMRPCKYCNGAFVDEASLAAHEPRCRFNPAVRDHTVSDARAASSSSTVEAFRRFGARLEKKAHETKRLADESFIGNSATLVATAILCVAHEATAFADELEKEGWGQEATAFADELEKEGWGQ